MPNTGKPQQLLGTHNGVFQPRFLVESLDHVVGLRIRLHGSEKFCALQVIEIRVDLPG